MTQQLEISPDLDPEALGRILQQQGRLQVAKFFTAETADYLHRIHVENKDWYLAYNDGNNYFESSVQQIQAAGPQQQQQLMNSIYARARSQFQYVFYQYYISQAIDLKEQPGHPMHQIHEFMNSEEVLNLMRTLTGERAIRKADSYASNYAPGHFLTAHDDRHDSHDRVAAYVFSMTDNWDKNWGGHLAFFDDADNIEEAFVPTFNSLNIFLVPQMHSVQLVSPFAGRNRTSYLGWLHR
ncbi:MAG: 2OG-Fe(II) oxygenase [Gammaproteobacteria bacterium]|nr:2OG-Fe(II) oxygenase [Gammaproteobacteria bacterium]